VHRLLVGGVEVAFPKPGGEGKTIDLASLIDFNNPANNEFLVVSQFTVQGSKQPLRPDLVAFINGLPVAVIELKNPANEQVDIWDAFNQLQTYKAEGADLFNCNVALVVSDGFTARVGSLTADAERMLPWRTIASENDRPQLQMELETLVRGFFKPALLLDYLRHFVLFEQDGDILIKKVAGYHQFHAVREAVAATVIAAQEADKGLLEVREDRATWGQQVQPGSRKAGVVWHTQGSGKSITMACYAGKLLQQPAMKNPTLVVVTDRNDLDGQLFGTFCAASDLLKTTPLQATGRDELRDMLASRQAGGVIFTTVQKFALLEGEDAHPALSARTNIVVMSDEAHRSQYGMNGRLDTQTGKYVFGFAKHMRDALKNATFIGFTGTPIALEDKDTRAVFGDYVSIYDIQDAVDDGATVPIYYESRLAKLDVNQADIDALNAQVDEVVEDEEDLASREKTKSEWAALEKLVGADPRLKQVAMDLVQHFEARISTIDGKAMIVCMSREICVRLYNAITALRPGWHSDDPAEGAIKVVMTASSADKPLLQPHRYTHAVKKSLEKRFKNPADPLKLVIVRDMWLTGFDAPCCHSMYVDKPMKGHNLMQAIARVNRVFKNKPGGLVVDYIGIANELKAALKTYTDAKGKGDPAHNAAEALAVLLEKMDIVRGLMHGFDYSAFETQALTLLVPVANHLLGLKDGKQRFLDVMTAVSKAFSLCGTLDEAVALRKEIAFFAAVKAAITKFTTVDKKCTAEDKNSALKQILDNAIVADGVSDIFALAGLDKPNIGLLSDEFLEDVRQMKSRNLAVELLEKLLRDEIKARARNNVVQEKKYGDRLLETLRQYHNRAIETAQVIEELIAMAKEFQAVLEREAALGLGHDEIAFYDALANNESAVRELGDEILKKIAVEITEKLRASTTVDWQVRDSVRAKLRILVRRTLQRWKYPPDQQADAVELVLKQAETLSNEWSK
jgi:type I restriction enzyme, R subunit